MNPGSFVWLFITLILFLAGLPIAEDTNVVSPGIARSGAFSVLLAIGVWSLIDSRRLLAIGMVLALLGIALNIAAARSAASGLLLASFVVFFSFLAIAVAHAFERVAFARAISLDRVLGAICVYMLLGIIYAVAYAILHLLVPDAFSPAVASAEDLNDWLYFSFVTMTTLGFGDIVPVTATARSLAYSQAVVGQFYIAILVAGLVSAYIAAGDKD